MEAESPPPGQGQVRVQDEQDTNDEGHHQQKEGVKAGLVSNIAGQLSAATRAIHADDHLNETLDVAPPMHVSTTFHHRHPKTGSKKTHDERKNNMDNVDIDDRNEKEDQDDDEELVLWDERNVESLDQHIYSRDTAPNSTRLEAILSSLLKAKVVTYSSGLSAYHAALVHLNPKRISIGDAYHGCHGVIDIHQKLTNARKLPLDCPAQDLEPGDVVHVETPMNPTGEVTSIGKYAAKAHSRGAFLLVDATFGPPGLQDPFEFGADVVLHSGTKYLGGHSDMLCGVLAVRRDDWFWALRAERCHLGSMLGSFEAWLGVRSSRTLELRVQRQSRNAEMLVAWLQRCLDQKDHGQGESEDDAKDDATLVKKVVERVAHASLQARGYHTGPPPPPPPPTRPQGNRTLTLQQQQQQQPPQPPPPLPETSQQPTKDKQNQEESIHGQDEAPEETPRSDRDRENQDNSIEWIGKQMPNGFGPVFAIYLRTTTLAQRLPSRLTLFHHATSLGGVESLIEWRRMTDSRCDPRLVRVSVGVEGWEDLKRDFLQAFRSLS